jgi:hypothetical protein
MSKDDDSIELQFMTATDRMNRMYPQALMIFKRNLVSQGFSSSEAFELTKLYLELLVNMVYEVELEDQDKDEDEEDF